MLTLTRSLLFVAALFAATFSLNRVSAQDVPEPPHEPFDLAAAIRTGAPMSADRAAELALSAAPELDQARALSRAAEAAVSLARAAMLPRLDLGIRYAHIDGFPDGQFSTGLDPAALEASRTLAMNVNDPAAQQLWLGTIDQQASGSNVTFEIPRDQFGFSARLTWPVSDMFLAMMPALDAAEAGTRSRDHQRAAIEAGISRSAREAYYQLARARGAFAVVEEAQRQAEVARAEIDSAVQAGFLTEADHLAAEARVASAAQAVASARAGVVMADAALRALTDEDGDTPYGIADSLALEDRPLEPVGVLLLRAPDQRAELAAIRESLVSQRAVAQANDATGLPHLAVFAGADFANPNRYMIPPQQEFQPSWEVGAMLTWAPNDTLTAVHRGQELGAQRSAREAQLAQLERRVRLEVRQAHARAVAVRESLAAAIAAERAAQAAYDSRSAQLRAGATTSAAIFDAEGQLNRARLALLDASVAARIADVRLRYAAGE